MAAGCPGMPVGLDCIAASMRIHPLWGIPRLAGAAGVRALLGSGFGSTGSSAATWRGFEAYFRACNISSSTVNQNHASNVVGQEFECATDSCRPPPLLAYVII